MILTYHCMKQEFCQNPSCSYMKRMNGFASDLSDVVRHVDDVSCMYNDILNCPAIKELWGSFFQGFLTTLSTLVGSAVVVKLCGTRRHVYYLMTTFITLLLCFAVLFNVNRMFSMAFSVFLMHG